MGNDDTDDIHAALQNDPRLILATTLATILVAGSAFMWRSMPKIVGFSSGRAAAACTDSGSGLPTKGGFSGADIKLKSTSLAGSPSESLGHDEPKETKASRSKERRRRGKDPLKEMLKGTKKNKGLLKAIKSSGLATISPDFGNLGSASSGLSRPSSAPPPSTSSRTSSFSNHVAVNSLSPAEWVDPDPESSLNQNYSTENDFTSAVALTPSTSTATERRPLLPAEVPQNSASDAISPTSTTTTSQSGSHPSVITPNTSPASSPAPGEHPSSESQFYQPKQSKTSAQLPSDSMDLVSPRKCPKTSPVSREWHDAGFTTNSDFFRKPPRFRTKSRASEFSDVPLAPSIDFLGKKPRKGNIGHQDVPLTFSNTTTSEAFAASPVSPSSCKGTTRMASASNTSGNAPRRVTSPRSTQQSGTITPPPSLSVQTQLASLTGALEAARMREEKTKNDLDKYGKDLERLRKELSASRRREDELKSQIHYLLQNQPYMSVLSPSLPSQNCNNSNVPGSSTSASTSNGYPGVSNHPVGSVHLQASTMFPNGMLSSPQMSPLSIAHPHMPFYAYSPQSPQSHLQRHPQLHPQARLYPMMYPYPSNLGNGTTSGSSSVAGSSSVGSLSPDLAGTPPPPAVTPPVFSDHELGISRRACMDAEDGWMVDTADISEGQSRGANCEWENGDELSEVLADAILKRPGSIKELAGGRKKEKKEKEQPVEFTFPSISDLGNVLWRGGRCVVSTEAGDGQDRQRMETTDAVGHGHEPEDVLVEENHSEETPRVERSSGADTRDGSDRAEISPEAR